MLSQDSSSSAGSSVPAPTVPLQSWVPTPIANYTVLAPLAGSGAQADLYIAAGEDHQRYALKLYRGFTGPSALVAQALADLPSSRLSIPIDRGEWEGRALEVTEYFPQGNLAEFIKKNGALDREQRLRLLIQVTAPRIRE